MIAVKTDELIQDQVEQELRWDTRVQAPDIGVAVHNGIVTLTGVAASLAEKIAAQEAAHRVIGVLDVANDIEVRVPHSRLRSDADIARAVRNTLEWNALVPHERIRSTVTNGWVTLEGTVASMRQRTDAGGAVLALDGVVGVSNDIVVEAGAPKPVEVRHAIEEALERRAEREANRIAVQVQGNTVLLSGRVRTWEEQRAVVGAAEHAAGVQSIENHLIVDRYS